MSGRRPRSRSRDGVSEEEIGELISKLQALLPETRRRRATTRSPASSAAGLLKDTCSYIKTLHREVDDLSERLSEMITAMDFNSTQAELLRSLFR